MKYLIFDNKTDCYLRLQKINSDINWNGITNSYCIPIKHCIHELYAIIVHEDFIKYFTEEEINEAQELTDDWVPKIEFNNE